MKIIIGILLLMTVSALAQTPEAFLASLDQKVYSLKGKGTKELVFDIESPGLTKQLSERLAMGRIESVTFRVYWTANPERLAIEVLGLPEGFREIKEELRLSILPQLQDVLPSSTAQRFAGYTFHKSTSPREVLAKDSSGAALIPSFIFKYDTQDRLVEIVGEKPVGEYQVTPVYEKESFSDGKWVLKSITVRESEGGRLNTSQKTLTYTQHQGIGVLARIKIAQEVKSLAGTDKPLNSESEFLFKNYKINSGEALQYFLADPNKTVP
jgi:hypothetical protein